MDRKIIVTEDKSKTLLIPALNETYHSVHGALNEALHIYVETGFNFLSSNNKINIFEMGFGTGLNALVTLAAAIESGTVVNYHTIEKYPITAEEIKALDFNAVDALKNASYYNDLHELSWNKNHTINDHFSFQKTNGDILHTTLPDSFYDLIYYDAFGPPTQPDLWTESVMHKMYKTLKPGGILVTYCAQGQFKRNLKAAGFVVTNLPGPAGKREITRAFKPNSQP